MKAFNILSNVGNIDEWLCSNIEELPCSQGTYYLCQVINPDNELSDTYVATENGKYTFTVKDLITGKSYTKSVEVTNVDSALPYYYVGNLDESYGI